VNPPPRPQLPSSIETVWDHPLVEIITEPLTNGLLKEKKSWKCLAVGCGIKRSGLNTTKCLAHGSRDAQFCHEVHIKPCNGSATVEEIKLFASLMNKKRCKKEAVKRGNDLVDDDIKSSQSVVSAGILVKKPRGGGGFASANSSLSRNMNEEGGSPAVGRQIDVLSAFDKSTIDGCNSADLDAAIAQMVYCKALSFSFGECPYFKRVLEVARSAPRGYKPPTRNTLSGPMLDLAYSTQLLRDLEELLIDADIFGLAMFGDAATIHKCPLVNMFASSFKAPAILINIIDCTTRLLEGQKKDGTFISSLFLPVMESLDQLKDKVDILFFDGGSNFQLAGRIIQARFPRVTVVHGLEHVLSLVFEDIAKVPVVKVSHCISFCLVCVPQVY
jgi:hypothetical protein